jgi:phosphopantetheinyl transferase (holo-ACP synthase)
MKNIIQSQLEIVRISEIKKNMRKTIDKYFTEVELNEFGNKHIKTLAGFYADCNISEKEIILTNNSEGAPFINEIISFNNEDLQKFFISISHTSEYAYGFAAITDLME